ncbi:MAG: Hsp20/alpha crystallin family protein [Candidatus Kapaibacterium sp.]
MALIQWVASPFNSVERVMLGAMRRPASLEDLVLPNVDISEDNENFYLISELPGMKDDDVKVTVDAQALTMSGHKERRAEEKADERSSNRVHHRIERPMGEFVRTFSMPKNVNVSAISGTFHDGLLELTLPKITTTATAMREIPLNRTLTNGKLYGEADTTFVKSNGHIKSGEKAALA